MSTFSSNSDESYFFDYSIQLFSSSSSRDKDMIYK